MGSEGIAAAGNLTAHAPFASRRDSKVATPYAGATRPDRFLTTGVRGLTISCGPASPGLYLHPATFSMATLSAPQAVDGDSSAT